MCGTLAAHAGRGIETELLDLRTLKPPDEEATRESAVPAGRLRVLRGAPMLGGIRAEIAAIALREIC